MKTTKELMQLKMLRITNLYNRQKISTEEFAKRRNAILLMASQAKKLQPNK